jgi:hypothetical protein
MSGVVWKTRRWFAVWRVWVLFVGVAVGLKARGNGKGIR